MEKATRSAREENYLDKECYLQFLFFGGAGGGLLDFTVLICVFMRPYCNGLTCYSTHGVKTGNFDNPVALCVEMNTELLGRQFDVQLGERKEKDGFM